MGREDWLNWANAQTNIPASMNLVSIMTCFYMLTGTLVYYGVNINVLLLSYITHVPSAFVYSKSCVKRPL